MSVYFNQTTCFQSNRLSVETKNLDKWICQVFVISKFILSFYLILILDLYEWVGNINENLTESLNKENINLTYFTIYLVSDEAK